MNPIIAALLKEFKKRHELEAMEDPKAFEYFTSYCITTANGMDQGDFKETVTGGGEEGIDAIAITINGILVTDASDVSTMMESTTEAFVKYMFIQAKVGEKWESGEVLKLSHAVEGFFKDADIGRDAWVDTCREIHLEILNNAAKLSDNPSLYVAYVTSGKLPGPDAKGDLHPKKYLTQLERSLEGLDLFSDIGAHVLGNKELQSMYRSATTAATASINFKNRITLPPIAGVDQAYLGLLPAKELLALLSDQNTGELQRSIFEDNVRDFQGVGNEVNKGMATTLNGPGNSKFAAMNNGVTIVTKDLRVTADTFTLTEYQIVNGAQTSHVLFHNKEFLEDSDVHVPAKLIQTRDESLISDIVTATNSQTEIKADQLNARAEAERNIEKYFASTEAPRDLLYERRAKQYDDQPNVVKARVIDRTTLLRAVAATFGDEPHTSTGYAPQLVQRATKGSGGDLTGGRARYLSDDDEPALYYAAAAAHYRLDLLFKTNKLDANYKRARWHILAVSRQLAIKAKMPKYSDRKIRTWVEPYVDTIWDEQKSVELFTRAIKVIEDSGVEMTREALRSSGATAQIMAALKS